ncbi:UDP-3-O-(3-hydroxymyristoyl)glucosamine N-acyltransferase [Persephonella sp.]
MRISEIAKNFHGKVVNLKEDLDIKSVGSLENARKGDITFLANRKFLKKALDTQASAIITKEPINIDIPQIIVDKPDYVFYKLIDLLYPEKDSRAFVSDKVVIGKDVEIGEDVYIGDYVVIEDNVKIGNRTRIYPFSYIGKDTQIGEDTIIYPHVTIYGSAEIGNRVIIHSGVVISSDGFGYYQEKGKHKKIKHIGKVVIQDDVEIGANTTIDRAMIEKTVIGKGTKIDNLVMVAHNCQIGENSIIVGQVGMAGSCKIGNNVILAGQVGLADHITIGDNVIVTGKAGVMKDLPSNGVYGGTIPAIEWSKWKRILTYIMKLPELIKKLGR